MIKKVKGVTVLVTGAEGFIGSHLVAALCKAGARVHAIVYPGVSLWRLKGFKGRIDIYPLDLRDGKKISQTLLKVRPVKVYHLAANNNHERGINLLDKVFFNNFSGTLNLLRSCLQLDLDCFINTGTCEEYGTQRVPFKESQRECPVSAYSLSKVCNTYSCSLFHRIYGLPIVTLRPFLVYGPAQDPGMLIPALIMACLRGKEFKMTPGEQTREFNYVDDIVEGYLKASVAQPAIGEVINLGNGKEYRMLTVARMIQRLTCGKARLKIGALPYRPGESMHFYSDSNKAARILKWRSKTALEEGLRKTIAWYKENLHEIKYK
ncbi:MAG: GDP-mannose 4,6-dehydratase [Candidatus Omnitrophica bacterium]|nr:GDP-mannose 4,6-dehydratase [Candidatus Omnitrophota bacterium]